MSSEQVAYWDDEAAARYRESSADMYAADVLGPTVDFLAALATPGARAVELAVGTGRVAIPLAEAGIEVHGLDSSAAMVEQLRREPGGEQVTATVGDMCSSVVGEGFDLAYCVFNSLSNVVTQDGQVDVFANAAAHLRPGGCFVVEMFVPSLQLIPHGERFHTFHHEKGRQHSFDEYDVVRQLLQSHHYSYRDDGTFRLFSAHYRYAWPAELDLMARLAGLRLRLRCAWWDRSPFTAMSTSHVSVWEKA